MLHPVSVLYNAPALWFSPRYANILTELFASHHTKHEPLPRRTPTYQFERLHHETVLRVQLPGVNKEELDVRVTGRKLNISARSTCNAMPVCAEGAEDVNVDEHASRSGEAVAFGACVYRLEMRIRSGLDADGIKGEFREGVLIVVMPVEEAAEEGRR